MTGEQRRSILIAQRAELERKRAELENDISGASLNTMADLSAGLARVEDRIREIDEELRAIDGSGELDRARGKIIMELQQRLVSLEVRVERMERAQYVMMALLIVDILVRVLVP